MKKPRLMTMLAVFGLVSVLGLSGIANANPLYHSGTSAAMTQEQQTALQQIYADYEKQAAPLQRQLQAKRAELDALYYNNNGDSSKAKTLFREISDLEAKLFAVDSDLRSKLEAKGISSYGRNGGSGYAHGGGHGGRHRGGGHW